MPLVPYQLLMRLMWRCLKLPEPKRKKRLASFCTCLQSSADAHAPANHLQHQAANQHLKRSYQLGVFPPEENGSNDTSPTFKIPTISGGFPRFINHQVAGVTSHIPSQGESPRLQQKARREETLEPGRRMQSVPLLHPTVAT